MAESPQSLRQRLSVLDDDISQLQSKLKSLTTERSRVVGALSALTYPVDTLPTEIVGQIVAAYIENPGIGGGAPLGSPSRGPLLLASVCRRWRDIVFSLSALWTELHVFPRRNYPDVESYEGLVTLLGLWLSRARGRAIFLRLQRTFRQDLLVELYNVIVEFAPQIRYLEVALDYFTPFPNEELLGRLPILETLVVDVDELNRDGNNPLLTLDAFSAVPQLREVMVNSVRELRLPLPWAQITHLTFRQTPLFWALEILRLTTRLEYLSASMLLEYPLLPASASEPIQLQSLRTLVLHEDNDDFLVIHLTCPNLSTLFFNGVTGKGGWRSSLLNTARRSQFPLSSLRIVGMSCENIIGCLTGLQDPEQSSLRCDIQSLDVEIMWRDEHFASFLQFLVANAPRLRRLGLDHCPTDISLELLAQVIAGRLEKLHVSFSTNDMRLVDLDRVWEALESFKEVDIKLE